MLVVKGAVRSTHQSSDLLIILGYDLFRPKQLLSETNLYVWPFKFGYFLYILLELLLLKSWIPSKNNHDHLVI